MAAANQRRVSDAGERLALVFDPMGPVTGDFSVAQPEQISVRGMPTADRVWSIIDDLLVHEDMCLPHLTFELTGATTHDLVEMRTNYEMLRPDVAEVAAKLSAGAGMLLRWIDECFEPMWDLCADLEAITGVTSRASALVLPGGRRPLPQAPLDADRIVIPIDGPLRVEVVTGETDPHGFELAPGAAVVVPVDSQTTIDATQQVIILIIDVGRAWASSLADIAASDAKFFPLLRADVPAVLDAPIRSYAGSLHERPGDFVAASVDVLAPRAFDRAVAVARSELPARPRQRLRQLLEQADSSTGFLRAPHTSGVSIAESGDRWFAVVGDQRLLVDGQVLEVLGPVLDGRVVGRSVLTTALEEVDVDAAALIDALVAVEVLEIVSAP